VQHLQENERFHCKFTHVTWARE